MVIIAGEKPSENEISFKPGGTPIEKYWGRVNDITYSIPVNKVTSCVILANAAAGDKVWIDSRVAVPTKVVTPLQYENDLAQWKTVKLPLWTDAPDGAEAVVRVDQIGAIVPHVVFPSNTSEGSSSSSSGPPLFIQYGTAVWTLRHGVVFVHKPWEEVAAMLAEQGWGNSLVNPYAYPPPPTPTNLKATAVAEGVKLEWESGRTPHVGPFGKVTL
jgi:hypothetical protein